MGLCSMFDVAAPEAAVPVSGALSGRTYEATWFNPRTGEWIKAGKSEADANGAIRLSVFPGPETKSTIDWAVKLARAGSR